MEYDPSVLVPKEYVGIPWTQGGRDFSGIDCIGIVWLYCVKVGGMTLPDTDGIPIPRDWKKQDAERMVREMLKLGDLAPLNKLKQFDVVLLNLSDRSRIPDHAAVMVSGSCFLHILENKTSRVEKINQVWKECLVGAVRFGNRTLLPEGADARLRM